MNISVNILIKQVVGLAILLGAVTAANALECIIEAKTSTVKVQWANKKVAVIRQMASSNCVGAKIVEGEAIVYYAGTTGDSANIQIKAGQVISLAMLKSGANRVGQISSVISQMSRILLGDTGFVTGQSRGLAEPELPGFPYRNILPPKGLLNINLDQFENNSLDSFSLVNDDTPSQIIFSVSAPSSSIQIEAALIQKGGRYTWTAIKDLYEFHGHFVVATAEEEKEIGAYRKELELTNSTLTPLGKALAEAALYSKYKYEFDSARALRQAVQF